MKVKLRKDDESEGGCGCPGRSALPINNICFIAGLKIYLNTHDCGTSFTTPKNYLI